jgi:hypothetical protein
MAAAVYDIGKLDVGLVTCFGHLSKREQAQPYGDPKASLR